MSLAVTALMTVWEARKVSGRQGRRAAERANLSSAEFEQRLGVEGVSIDVARRLHSALLIYCGGGLRPHPDDDLASTYALDPDELVLLVEGLWNELGFPKPTTRPPERIPEFETVLDLALYLQRASERGQEPDMQKPPESGGSHNSFGAVL